jgi:hypothetical protein
MTTSDRAELWVAVGLFIFSELVGMSKAKDNSLTQVALRALTNMFSLEIKTKSTRRLKRDPRGRFTQTDRD